MNKIGYLSLFSGIGGFERGIETSNKKDILECIGYSEIDKYAKKIYKKHYPNHIDRGDATLIRTEDLPDFDFLVGGFPCQAFSVAGKRMGFDDTRGTLFFEISRILKDKRPKYFLLENVKGLLSHESGKTFQRMLGILSDLGYYVQWQIYNSKNHGVPQERERLYIKGYLGSRSGQEVLSVLKNGTKTHATSRKDERKQKLKYNRWGDQNTLADKEYISPTLCADGQQSGGQICVETEEGNITFSKVDEERYATTSKTGDSVIKVGNVSPSGHRGGDVMSVDGLSPTLCARDCKGAKNIAIVNKKVNVRKYKTRDDEIRELLRSHKEQTGLTIKDISEQLGVTKTEAEHWFRTDNHFQIPNKKVWHDLKQLLNIQTTEYDKEITTYITREGVYDMSKRAYNEKSTAPTLCSSPSLVQVNNEKSQSKRVYSIEGTSSTLMAEGGGMGAKTGLYDVTTEKPHIKVVGNVSNTQHWGGNVYSTDGIIGALTRGQYKYGNKILLSSDEDVEFPRNDNGEILLKNNTRQGYLPASSGDGVVLDFDNAKGRVQKQKTPTLTTSSNVGTVTDELLVRRLTPLECERLQAFPDRWTEYGCDGERISDTQRYKCCGNAVTTTVVRDILNDWEMIF